MLLYRSALHQRQMARPLWLASLLAGLLGFAMMLLLDSKAAEAFRAQCRSEEYPAAPLTLVHPYGLWLPVTIATLLVISVVIVTVMGTAGRRGNEADSDAVLWPRYSLSRCCAPTFSHW